MIYKNRWKIFTVAVIVLVLSGIAFSGSQQTSTTTAQVIVNRVRYYLNETTADFWADAELLVWVNDGTVDIVARTQCLEGSEDVTLLQNTVEYSITGPYIAVTTVIYTSPNGIKKGLILKNPQSVGHSKDTEPAFWYDWNGKVGVYPAPMVVTDANLAIGSTKTNVATGAFSYLISNKTYAKAAVTAGTAPGDDVVPQSKYGAVAFDIGSDGTIDALEAYANAIGYTSAALGISGLPPVGKGHIRLGYVTTTKSDGAFTFGTTDFDAANTTVAYTDSLPTVKVYFVETPAAVAIDADVLVPAIYDRALMIYVAAQAFLKEGAFAKSGRLMAEYLLEIDRYRADYIARPRESEDNVTR